jgi:hypothetical protein
VNVDFRLQQRRGDVLEGTLVRHFNRYDFAFRVGNP